jgi:hypothetical protein
MNTSTSCDPLSVSCVCGLVVGGFGWGDRTAEKIERFANKLEGAVDQSLHDDVTVSDRLNTESTSAIVIRGLGDEFVNVNHDDESLCDPPRSAPNEEPDTARA